MRDSPTVYLGDWFQNNNYSHFLLFKYVEDKEKRELNGLRSYFDKSKDNFNVYKLSQEMFFLKLINPARKSIREIAKSVSYCREKLIQTISAIAYNS